ncbi:MAG TPA: glycosyltransferase family 4 protein [Puia sp.]|uniref:glycosyltransferase family 4 protein n=1 Tax=Puia sp. TaxID=2045100 RepID=UPI002C0CD0EB|nr:glycosyltransferase family 4 protein [Puia sp.]HVU95093.1 glycosyltransferase family 4 protein [Puia sp.]
MNRKIRVLECIRQGQIGGGETHLLSLTGELDKSLFEPVVLSFTDGPMIERLKGMGIETHVIYTERPFDVTKWGRVKRLIENLRPDLVHAHGTRASSNVLWAARSLGIPVIYTVHGWSFHKDQSFLVRQMRTFGERYITRRTDLNIAVSRANGEAGKRAIPGFEYKLVLNGIDRDRFSPLRRSKDVRAELGIGADAVVVLFLARFTVQKQPIAAIEAFRLALPEVQNLRLVMVGDGDLKEQGVMLVEQYGLQDKVTFTSFRQDVPDVLAAADIFVLPSLWEGLPIGLLEAMAMGKAVIASDVDGTAEVIRDRVNGRLVSTEELVPALSRVLIELANDPVERRKMGERAMESINEKYNVEAMTEQIEGIYLEIAAKKAVL